MLCIKEAINDTQDRFLPCEIITDNGHDAAGVHWYVVGVGLRTKLVNTDDFVEFEMRKGVLK